MTDLVSAPTTRVAPARRRLRLFGAPSGERRPKVVKRGWLGSVLAPLSIAVSAILVVGAALSFGTTFWTSYQRAKTFQMASHPDASLVSVGDGQPLREEVTVLMRDEDGALRRLVVEKSKADRFANDSLRRLDAARDAAKAAAAREVSQLFDLAFANRDEAISDYADWFFAWRRPYVVLKEAVASTATHLVEVGEYEPLRTAVERDLKQYFLDSYSERVLKPEFRDPMITRGFEEAARRARERYEAAVAAEDLRLQLFLAKNGRPVAGPADDAQLTSLELDWDAQAFKAPAHLMEDTAFDGVTSLATIGAGGTIGAFVLRPAMERATGGIFAGLGRRFAAAFAGRIAMTEAGAAAGTVVQPVGGTVMGAVAGGLIGIAADYAMNEASEAWNRESFVEANEEAVSATVGVWQGKLTDGLDTAIDRWFEDGRAAVVAVAD